MKDLEKQIERAAKDSSNGAWNESDWYSGFMKGAKSPEAKAFHTQGMYSEEEIKVLLNEAFYDIGYSISLSSYPDGTIQQIFGLDKWFEKIKKK